MKFGKQFQGKIYPEWRFYYVDYDRLKRMIKDRTQSAPSISAFVGPGESASSADHKKALTFDEEDEATFVEALEKEIDKVIHYIHSVCP